MGHTTEKTGIPARLIVGDTWAWIREVPSHRPSDGWSLRYELHRVGHALLTIEAETDPDADRFRVHRLASQTGSHKPGRYRWAESVHRGDDRYTLETGTVFLQSIDRVSMAERMVPILEEALQEFAEGATEITVTVAGRTTSYDRTQVLRELGYWKSQLWRQRNSGRLGPTVAAVMRAP